MSLPRLKVVVMTTTDSWSQGREFSSGKYFSGIKWLNYHMSKILKDRNLTWEQVDIITDTNPERSLLGWYLFDEHQNHNFKTQSPTLKLYSTSLFIDKTQSFEKRSLNLKYKKISNILKINISQNLSQILIYHNSKLIKVDSKELTEQLSQVDILFRLGFDHDDKFTSSILERISEDKTDLYFGHFDDLFNR